jgi:hypothetical protein
MKTREIVESPLPQGADENITYGLDVTNWGNTPTSPVVKVFQVSDSGALTDVTATVTTGSSSVVLNVVILPKIHSLTAGLQYRVEIKFNIGVNIFEPYCILAAET